VDAGRRPHPVGDAAPVTVPSGGTGNAGAGNGWVISDLEKAQNGQVLSRDDLYHYFQGLPSSVQNSANPNAFTSWLTRHGYTAWTSPTRGSGNSS